jgi:hypothetical protein
VALTIEEIRGAKSDEALVDLISAELLRLLPEDLQADRDRYYVVVDLLPRGLRAMAGMHFFSVSMTLDDLAWHFGNQNDERDLSETLNGLRELELTEIADLFQQAWRIMEPHFVAIRGNDVTSDNFYEWLESIGAKEKIDPMNDIIWDFCQQAGDLGLLSSWPVYARKHPERCVVAAAQ